jgi:DNA helicase-2/ATP-dependent DNA helicase PcrA
VKYTLKTSTPRKPLFDLEADLNPQQRAVVEAPPAKILVLAGAGTGKTRTLTYRVARLVSSGCPPERIMLVTFTNRAAKEMVARVEGLLAMDMRRCAAGTFHHVGNRLLRQHGELIGVNPDFGILDPEDSRDVITGVVGELGLPTLTARRFPNAKVLSSIIGMASGMQLGVSDVIDRRYPRFLQQSAQIERVAAGYTLRKRRLNVCDFDDLLSLWLRLLRDPATASVADQLRSDYDHLLVDEYQDINSLQGAIVDGMVEGHGSLTCVGDDAQSIYSFRGADFSQIHDFKIRHHDAQVLPLTINYRSTPQILELANRSIAHNQEQHPKQLTAVRKGGPPPAVIPLRDVYQQAEFVAQRVLELHHEQNLPLRRMAVLYRNHAHSLELQVELTRRQIPYFVRSGTRFFEQAHIKDVVSYLRARENPRDSLAWVRLLRLWPGIGTQTSERIASRIAGDEDRPCVSIGEVGSLLEEQAQQGKGRARTALERLAKLWGILADAQNHNPGAGIRLVLEEHYGDYLDRSYPNAEARREDLQNLAAFAERYDDATNFLSELALIQGMSAEQVVSAEEPDDKLVLSTIHQAKGLEWPIVFTLWLAEGRFPMAQSLRRIHDLEEERRLFYVAATRAADELYLGYPTVEEGKDGPNRLLRPSRFLTEIDHLPTVFERWEVQEEPP